MKVKTQKKQAPKARSRKSPETSGEISPLTSITETLQNLVQPYCSVCRKRTLPHKHCSLCGEKAYRNKLKALLQNHAEFKVTEKEVVKASFVCTDCLKSSTYLRCLVTEKPFYSIENCAEELLLSGKLPELVPYVESAMKFCDGKMHSLSPDGLSLVEKAYEQYLKNFRLFIGGTKHEYVKGFDVVRMISRIEVKKTVDCQNPSEVEDYIKRFCAQLGANGFIKFFYDKIIDHHEEEYVAGYGKKGNAYYRTRHWTTACYVGTAEAVILRPRKSKPRN